MQFFSYFSLVLSQLGFYKSVGGLKLQPKQNSNFLFIVERKDFKVKNGDNCCVL